MDALYVKDVLSEICKYLTHKDTIQFSCVTNYHYHLFKHYFWVSDYYILQP